jgi:hypothetical protein
LCRATKENIFRIDRRDRLQNKIVESKEMRDRVVDETRARSRRAAVRRFGTTLAMQDGTPATTPAAHAGRSGGAQSIAHRLLFQF